MTRARRSHPPTLAKIVERALAAEGELSPQSRILVAVSGGPDSQAMLHVLCRLRERMQLELFAHGVDHGTRPEARAELDLAEALARQSSVPFDRTQVRVEKGGNLMARARTLRYAALRAAAGQVGASLIATGHHADDRAETVLLRLLRGAGPRGLSVLPLRDGDLLRPLVRARRTDVQAHVARHRLAVATDPSNENPRFLRTRVRRELLPLLESLSPRVVDHLNALADQLGDPELPFLTAPDGAPVRLGRAQSQSLRQLLKNRDIQAEIWLPGGRAIRLDPASGVPHVVPATRRGAAIRRKSD